MNRTLYNEIDPGAARWILELCRNRTIPHVGRIDQGSISNLTSDDIQGFTHCHFFAGISGWAHALELAGWPEDRSVWTGSCPCQPFSSAGKQLGESDSRHLWPEFRRLIAECRPPTIFGEQVASPLGRQWLARVRADLEALGYAVGAADLCAASVGAPHIRQRLYWVANAAGSRLSRGKNGGAAGETDEVRRVLESERGRPVGRVADADNSGSQGRGRAELRERADERAPRPGGDTGGMVDTDSRRLNLDTQRDGESSEWDNRELRPDSNGPGFWSRFDIVHCRDGKARRFEPESFPLAHGVSGRVGLLRGYGNAIVPQVAAEFIRAFMNVSGITPQSPTQEPE